ncbi:putative angiopoietin-1 receptor-like, partial [Apostichopus japonicus]
MEWSFNGSGPIWRINGSRIIDTNEDYDIISNRGARAGDNGLYEGYPGLYRNDGRHVLRRLIVRDHVGSRARDQGKEAISGRKIVSRVNGVHPAVPVSVIIATMEEFAMTRQGNASVLLDSWGQIAFQHVAQINSVILVNLNVSKEDQMMVAKGDSFVSWIHLVADVIQDSRISVVQFHVIQINMGLVVSKIATVRMKAAVTDLRVNVIPKDAWLDGMEIIVRVSSTFTDTPVPPSPVGIRYSEFAKEQSAASLIPTEYQEIPDDCMDGYYGSQCTSKCLCYMDAPCDKTTGRCQTTCVPWFRTRYNTQTCQSCSAGLFGDSCTRECHCESDACDSVTGECVGCCKRQWLDGTNLRCQEGILNVTGNIVNPGVKWSSVTCWSRELTGNSTRYPVNLVRSLVSHDDSGVTLSNRSDSQSDDFTLRGWNYTIDNPQAGDQFYCWIPMSTAQLNATLSYYELLVLSNPPELLDVTSTSIDIRWAAWEEEIDVGDPPLVGYVVHIKEASSTLWTNRSVIINSLEYRLIHLEHDTNYTVSVSAVREGEMGEGPRGPPITVKTLCQVPTITPTNITATVTDINHLNITWQIENSGEEPIQLRVVPASTTWTIITEGLVPGLTYIFLVSLTTDLESSLGEASMAVTFPMPQSS